MEKLYWIARAEHGTRMVQGIVGIYTDWEAAQEARVYFQTRTNAGLTGDTFIVIDPTQLPLPEAA